jgi:2'-5' RNA ligase
MRLFTAIKIPDNIKDEIISKRMLIEDKGIIPVKKEALHITLHFFGEKSEKESELIKEALSSVEWRPFKITLSGIGTFDPKFIRVIFVKVGEGSNELSKLYINLSASLSNKMINYEKENYIPHATIARVKYGNKQKLLSFIEKYLSYDFGSFEVNSFFLIKSTLTREGPIYEDLYEFKASNVF